jgi:hypothetical protein
MTRRRSSVEIMDGGELLNRFTTKVVINRGVGNPAERERQADRSGEGRDFSHRGAKQSPLMM